jgi:hypothetical protein
LTLKCTMLYPVCEKIINGHYAPPQELHFYDNIFNSTTCFHNRVTTKKKKTKILLEDYLKFCTVDKNAHRLY